MYVVLKREELLRKLGVGVFVIYLTELLLVISPINLVGYVDL